MIQGHVCSFIIVVWLMICTPPLPHQAPVVVEAACNVCQGNGAACMNLTSFYMCYGGDTPYTDQLFTCNAGLVCSDMPNICFQSSTRPASCGDTSTCSVCNANQVFACTSRTTFAFCFGALVPSDVSGSCPAGLLCDASTQEICVNELTESSIVCDREDSELVR